MTNDQTCNGFNVFFHQQFFNAGTANSKKNLEHTEKIIEQWKKLSDEDKMEWQQKEEELKIQVKSKNNQKTSQSQGQLENQNRQKSKANNKDQNAIEDIQNSIQSLKFEDAKQNYIKRISEKNSQKEVNDSDGDQNVEPEQKPQQQKQSKKNTQRKKQIDDDDDDYVEEIKQGRKSNVRQSKPRQSRSRCKSGQRSGCGKRRM
ncbi:unnamed protein product (macronuclear) [Paramecium tetraurelia]|uniref:HMG box domain-containing protein n=1 Tax=Paramecium tetraurelia TaxID=5888 RepID=A0DNG8_PARTE|nr:uncharacterized protein GSPATT00018781001 [Paramecium tetraurelia]CAK84585.1 unnamed protein product [Paramecium tetraurelia]|eukprot:XP_001451982.1 hypothetical protein (macronuclear) [Paramecium tetraurelia strain d4-2]